jgi:Tfp pilus assembly protein PilX
VHVRRRLANRERGSALVFALVMIVMVGTLATVTLAYGNTSLRSANNAIGPDRNATFAAGGAVELATKYLEANSAIGRAGGAVCGDTAAYSPVASLPATGDAPAVDVQCKPASNSGTTQGGSGGVDDTTPAYSILALGTNNNVPGPYNNNPLSAATAWDTNAWAERGIDLQKSSTGGNSTTTLTGNVYSNAPVRRSASSGALAATGPISARGACENVSPCTVVPYGIAPVADPGYPSRTPDLTPRTVPSCPGATLVKFQPGWYSSASALNNLFSTCKNKDFWFQPGVYYFDFRDTSGGTQCRPGSTAAADALHEWCIGPYADSKSVALGGTPAGGWSEPTAVDATLTPSSVSDSPSGEFTQLSFAKVIDNRSASTTFSTWWWNQTESITVSSFGTAISSSATVNTVALDITTDVTQGNPVREVTVTAGDGTDCGTTTITDDSATISGLESCLSTPTKLNGATVRFDATAGWFTTVGVSMNGAQFRVNSTPGTASRFVFPNGCDPSASGVQWIFGGDSRLYVSDGSVELCAGPNPEGSTTNQQIAVYGVPPTKPVVPAGTSTVAGQSWATVSNGSNALTMGEQSAITNATISVTPQCGSNPGQIGCWFGFGSGDAYGSVRLDFAPGQFALPANTKLQKVELHASYDQGAAAFDNGDSPEFVIHQYQNPSGWKCSADSSFPATNQTSSFWRSVSSCLDATRLASGFSIEWRAQVHASCAWGMCDAAQSRTLDGLEVRVALDPTTPSTAVVVPEDGCIAPFPNDYTSGSGDSATNRYGSNAWNDNGAPDCALLKWDAVPRTSGTASQVGCYSGQVSLQGTLYAPGAAVDFDQAGPKAPNCNASAPTYTSWSYPIFARGAVVRTLRIKGMRATAGQSIGSCGSPSCGGVESDRVVTLQARIGGTTKLTARVRFPAAGGAPRVVTWTVS